MTDMQVIEGGKPYTLRKLKSHEERKIGEMVAKVTGDPRVQNAVASGDQGVTVLAFISAILDRAVDDLAVLCADLIGETSGYDLDARVEQEQEKARAEGRFPVSAQEIERRMNREIVAKMDNYPTGTYMDIISDVIEAPEFDNFLASTSRLTGAATKLSEKLQKPSKKGSGGRTKK